VTTGEFFEAPEPQSIIKTQLVTKYFGAWSTFMVSRLTGQDARLAYVDLFAGPG
jgi:hypothetical protein